MGPLLGTFWMSWFGKKGVYKAWGQTKWGVLVGSPARKLWLTVQKDSSWRVK